MTQQSLDHVILVTIGKFQSQFLKLSRLSKILFPLDISNCLRILNLPVNLEEWLSLTNSTEPTWPLGSRQIPVHTRKYFIKVRMTAVGSAQVAECRSKFLGSIPSTRMGVVREG
jgi:hypothetical protein